MIKAGTSKERVAEILKASGLKRGDQLVFFADYIGRYASVSLSFNDVDEGFISNHDYLYAIRLEKDGPQKIELVEPKELTLREKMEREISRALDHLAGYYSVHKISDICAKVAEEHFKK